MHQSVNEHIRYRIEGKVFIMQIHRPAKKNALLPGMYQALAEGIRLADTTDTVNVILIHGTEDCFTSGNDVNSFVAATDSGGERPSVQLMHALTHAKKPIVAAVSGLAIGIGTTMLFHCDLVYAADSCFMQLPFTRLGICPEAGSSYLLLRQIGFQRAAELLLLGERFDARKALELGIVTAVLSPESYLDFALSRANELAALPSDAVQTTKKLMKLSIQNELPEVIDRELMEFARLLKTDAAQAIMQAFLQKKK